MPLPKLSPLQSRLAASLIASVTILVLYLAFSFPQFAYAAEVDSIRPEDHNHDRLHAPFLDVEYEDLELREMTYEAEFIGADRGIIGRATPDITILINNRKEQSNVPLGTLVSYMFRNASLWGAKSPPTPGLPSQIILDRVLRSRGNIETSESRQEEGEEQVKLETRQSSAEKNRTLYITVTTCSQPEWNATTKVPSQLQLYVSTDSNNTNPGPTAPSNRQDMVELVNGYALYTLNATGDVWMGVFAKNDTGLTGVYNMEIAASIDAPYHAYWNTSDPNIFLKDSDDSSALLFTDPFMSDSSNSTLYEEWMDITPPFTVFLTDSNSSTFDLTGLERSYCGMQAKAEIVASRQGQTVSKIVTGMTNIGEGALPRQQFYVTGLSPGRKYNVALAMNGNSTSSGEGVVGGGGQVFNMTSFETLSGGNCAVIYELSFCDQVAYAVPSNPKNFPNMSALASFYDNATQEYYQNFQNVMSLTPCETTSSAQYSLARNCSSCLEAYKQWVCSVNIPRCTDFNSTAPWLQPRAEGQPLLDGSFLPDSLRTQGKNAAITNNSRNPLIDEKVVPGPYKEVLPCEDLCYEIVKSCPASLGFNCPQPGDISFAGSYGQKPLIGEDKNGRITNITCNVPGVLYYLGASNQVLPSQTILLISLLGTGLMLM